MTAARYKSYRRALAWIDRIEVRVGGPEATRVLRQSAEDLLLSREGSSQSEDPIDTAAIALVQLITANAISRSLADVILAALRESGPTERETAPVAVSS